jgi:hypothetical protein
LAASGLTLFYYNKGQSAIRAGCPFCFAPPLLDGETRKEVMPSNRIKTNHAELIDGTLIQEGSKGKDAKTKSAQAARD